MQIDKCIVYLAAQNLMTRVNYSEGDLRRARAAIESVKEPANTQIGVGND